MADPDTLGRNARFAGAPIGMLLLQPERVTLALSLDEGGQSTLLTRLSEAVTSDLVDLVADLRRQISGA